MRIFPCRDTILIRQLKHRLQYKMKKEIVIVAAVADDNVIGNKGKIPWWEDHELRNEDMHHFKKLTLGKPVIMGRKTAESIVEAYEARGKTLRSFERVLPDRISIIVSRNPCTRFHGAHMFHDLESAFDFAHFFGNEVCIIGGQKLYEQTLERATRLEMTEIEGCYDGDVFFPEYKGTCDWQECHVAQHRGYRFVTYVRNV